MSTNPSIRFNAGGGVLIDSMARTFLNPAGFWTGGRDEQTAYADIPNTADDELFTSRHVGAHFTFATPIASGHYTLFVEVVDPGTTAAGQRVFDVSAEGSLVADDLDVFAKGGANAFAVAKDLTIADGTLDLSFDASIGEALVNAFVLVPTDVPNEAKPYDPTRNTTEAAITALSASRLREIGLSIYNYTNFNKGKYPSSLATLVEGQGLPVDRLTNPRADTRPPRGVMSVVEEAAYARTLNDFVYVGAGLKNSSSPTLPAAYENPTRAAGSINVLYADGHTATLARADAATLLGFANVPPVTSSPPLTTIAADLQTVQSLQKLSALSRAATLYANDHRGRYPTDIGSLADYIGPDYPPPNAFSNPRLGSAAAPPIPAGLDLDAKIAWANAHSDYVLLRPNGSNYGVRAEDALLYERPAGLTGGLNLAFGDGSVAFRESRYAYQSIAPYAAPIVVASSFDPDKGTVNFEFDEYPYITPSASSLVLKNLTTGQAFLATGLSYTYTNDTLSFILPQTGNSALPDGNYLATLPANATGTDGSPIASDATQSLFILKGDVNHDRVVNFDDLVLVAQNYGKSGKTFGEGNLDHDPSGKVNFDDLVILSQRYNATLAAPALVAATTSPTSVKTGPTRRTVNLV